MKGFRVRLFGHEVLAVEPVAPSAAPSAPTSPQAQEPEPPKGVGAGQTLGTAERAWSPSHAPRIGFG